MKSVEAAKVEEEVRVLRNEEHLKGTSSIPDREQKRLWRSSSPKAKFDRPVLTSHQIGWMIPLDFFTPKQFGVKRNPELQAARLKSS